MGRYKQVVLFLHEEECKEITTGIQQRKCKAKRARSTVDYFIYKTEMRKSGRLNFSAIAIFKMLPVIYRVIIYRDKTHNRNCTS